MFIDIRGIIVYYNFPLDPLCPKITTRAKIRLLMLMIKPDHNHAIACSSSPRRSIALLNAFIIPSYIISWSWNVPMKISPSLIKKRAVRSSRASGLRFLNFSENSAMIVLNRFLTTWPCFVLVISMYVLVY